MVITLINCSPKLLVKGIDTTNDGWHEQLTTGLNGYISTMSGWDYDFETDSLKIKMSGLETVPANIVDFGDGSGVTLNE